MILISCFCLSSGGPGRVGLSMAGPSGVVAGMSERLPSWADGLSDARIRRLVAEVWNRLPEWEQPALAHVIREMIDDNPAPAASALASVGDADERLRPVVDLTRLREVHDDQAAAWCVAHEFAHAALRHSLLPVVYGLRFCAGPKMEAWEHGLHTIHAESCADILAALGWGFGPEFRAFLREFPTVKRGAWWADGSEEG